MKRLSSETEMESPLKRFRRGVNKVISSLAVIDRIKRETTDTSEYVALDIIRHGERSNGTVELPENTHIINISIAPVDCMIMTAYHDVLQQNIPAFFFEQLSSKLDEITHAMNHNDFDEFKDVITGIVTNELKRNVSQHIRKIGRVNVEERKIRITKTTIDELCEITFDSGVNNKTYSVKTLPKNQHSMIEFDRSTRSSRQNTSMNDTITTQEIINEYRLSSSKDNLWIVLLDSSCNVTKLGGKHFKKSKKNRISKYKNKRKIGRRTKRNY
jgi:hypothetical protein